MENLRFPIGDFERPATTTSEQRSGWIEAIATAPIAFRNAVAGLTEAQLGTPYRPDGWTVRQVVHHAADSHMHGYARTKFALTLPSPTIMPYDEAAWALIADGHSGDVELSLRLLDGLHARWAMTWRSLRDEDWQRQFLHPDNGPTRLDQHLANYAWHARHHAAHITALRARMGWTSI
jgi:hypothetical protein